MPPLEARTDFATTTTGRDPILRLRERMNKPIRKFNAKHYQSLDDNLDDNYDDPRDDADDCNRDDMTSFSSVKLARDQDKPTKKHLGTWKSKKKDASDESECSSLVQADSQLSSLTHMMGPHVVVGVPSAHSSDSNNENTAQNFATSSSATGSIRPLAPPRSNQREALGKIDPTILVQRKETAKFQNNKQPSHNNSGTESTGILSFWGSPFDPTSPLRNSNISSEKSPKLPDTLPSPKENRHPQPTGNRNSSSNERNPEEETTDARAALTPSSAMNLMQFWGRNNFANSEQEAGESNSQINAGANKNDPLLVALQVVRLKRELKKLRNGSENKRCLNPSSEDSRDALNTGGSNEMPMSTSRPRTPPTTSGRKSVRFSRELVTEVRERPFTDPEDMDKLYFVYGELEELEFDRSTVEHDQFECIIQEESDSSLETYVEVEHNSRKLHCIGDDGLPHSLSDLSFY